MAVEAIYSNPSIEVARPLPEPVQPGVKEWAKGAFESISNHAKELIEPSLEAINQIRQENAQKRGLARLNFALFDQISELDADRDELKILSQKIEVAKKDRWFWEQEAGILQKTMDGRQTTIERLLEERAKWTGAN